RRVGHAARRWQRGRARDDSEGNVHRRSAVTGIPFLFLRPGHLSPLATCQTPSRSAPASATPSCDATESAPKLAAPRPPSLIPRPKSRELRLASFLPLQATIGVFQ